MANDNILKAPRKLAKKDDRSTFTCGVASLDEYFRKWAWTNQRSHNAVVYVSTHNDVVAGCYAIATGAVAKQEAPDNFAQFRPQSIPVIILARLAVSLDYQGCGVGRALFADALKRCLSAAEIVGAAAILIHAHDERAKAFYMQYAEFQEMPGHPLHLLLPMRTG